MNDITKCNGVNCPIKRSCYRFTAKKQELQSWDNFQPYTVMKETVDGLVKSELKCDYFIDINKR